MFSTIFSPCTSDNSSAALAALEAVSRNSMSFLVLAVVMTR